MKIKPKFPEFNRANNSHGNNGVKGRNAEDLTTKSNKKTAKPHKSHLHEGKNKNNFASANLKAQIEGKTFPIKGLLNKISKNTNFFLVSTYQFNSESRAFTLNLSQNLQIATLLILEMLPPNKQSALKGINSKEIVLLLLLNVGLQNVIQGDSVLKTKSQNQNLSDSVLQRIFTFLSNGDENVSPSKQILNLSNDLGGLFNDCGCATTTKDLQNIAVKYADMLQASNITTLETLNSILKESQWQNPENAKLHTLLKSLINEGKIITFKEARSAILNQSKPAPQNVNQSVPKTTELNVKTKLDKFAKTNQSITTKNKIVVNEQDKAINKDFYSEKTENVLRKKLDYYPHYAYDRQISTFENPKESNLGRQDFVDKYYSEIEDWLKSGKHRLVKDFEFDKPLGMIVEREESGFITADKIRLVLVRDGSVEGWHFLRSFLIS